MPINEYEKLIRSVWVDERVPGKRDPSAPAFVSYAKQPPGQSASEFAIAGYYDQERNRIEVWPAKSPNYSTLRATVLHELAHALTPVGSAHGRIFQWTLALLEHLYNQGLHDGYAGPACGLRTARGEYHLCPLRSNQ